MMDAQLAEWVQTEAVRRGIPEDEVVALCVKAVRVLAADWPTAIPLMEGHCNACLHFPTEEKPTWTNDTDFSVGVTGRQLWEGGPILYLLFDLPAAEPQQGEVRDADVTSGLS